MQRAPLFANAAPCAEGAPRRTSATCSYSTQGALVCPEGFMNFHQASRSMMGGASADEAFKAGRGCHCKKACTPSVQAPGCSRCLQACQKR